MVAWLDNRIGRMGSLRSIWPRAIALRHLVMAAHGLAGWRGEVAFTRLILRALWPLLGFALTRHPPRRDIWRARVKAALRLAAPQAALIDPRDLPQAQKPPPLPHTVARVVIVFPVFNAYALMTEALRRVVAHTDLPWHLVCVDDGSTDPRVVETLRSLHARYPAQVTLAGWAGNRGFVAAANHGLTLALDLAGRDAAIVLLNSDAFVPPDWASRLTRPFALGPQVASVSPLSNDAEILSVPVAGQRVDLLPEAGDWVDETARRLPDKPVQIPTGMGFCMAISPAWLRYTGLFDMAFGRGYGEEVDWSQRARRAGGVHLATPRLFVTHHGGASFGSARKGALVRANHAIIARRYPRYDAGVAHFMATDPLATARIALATALAAATSGAQPTPVYLAHSGGGGAEMALQTRIRSDLARGLPCLVLRTGGPHRFLVEVVTPSSRAQIHAGDWGTITLLLHLLPRRRMIYSCGVGDSAPLEIPRELARLTQPDNGAEVWFHDYFPLSPAYTLRDGDGAFRGLPPDDTRDAAHLWQVHGRAALSLGAWRAAWHGFARHAEVVVFSRASLAFVRAAWPDLAGQIRLRPHPLPTTPDTLPVPEQKQGVVLGVLGNINAQKGAAIVQRIAHRIARVAAIDGSEAGAGLPPSLPRALIHLGQMDPAFAMPAPCQGNWWPHAPRGYHAHGPYHPQDIGRLALRYGITHWLIPSIWPETYCFAMHEALATGLPVLALDIGAQGEAARRAPNGIALPYPHGIPAADQAETIANAVCATLAGRLTTPPFAPELAGPETRAARPATLHSRQSQRGAAR